MAGMELEFLGLSIVWNIDQGSPALLQKTLGNVP